MDWATPANSALNPENQDSLTGSPFLKEEMKRMGYKTVPQIWNHRGEHIGGYDDLVRYFERTILSETK